METDAALNLLDAVLIIGVSIPSLYMASKVTQPKLRTLTVLLSGFLLVHGLYHATYVLGALLKLEFLSAASGTVFEPLGYFLFFAFAVYFARSTT